MLVARHDAMTTTLHPEEGRRETKVVQSCHDVAAGVPTISALMDEPSQEVVEPLHRDRDFGGYHLHHCSLPWADAPDWDLPCCQRRWHSRASEDDGPRPRPYPVVRPRRIRGSLGFQC